MVEGVITTGQFGNHRTGISLARGRQHQVFALHRYQTYQSSLATNPSHSLSPNSNSPPSRSISAIISFPPSESQFSIRRGHQIPRRESLGHHTPTHPSSPLHPLRSHFSRDPAGGERIPKCDYPVSVCSPEDQWARPNHPRCRSLFSQASGFARTLCFPGESGPAADSREHLVPCEGDEQLGLDKGDEADPSCGERCPIRPSIHTRRCHQ